MRRLLFVALAVAWVVVGALSSETHGFDTDVWVLWCSMIAGSAIAIARHGTTFALRTHLILVAAAAVVSAWSLAEIGRYRASGVWAVILAQALLVNWYVSHYGGRDDVDEPT